MGSPGLYSLKEIELIGITHLGGQGNPAAMVFSGPGQDKVRHLIPSGQYQKPFFSGRVINGAQ